MMRQKEPHIDQTWLSDEICDNPLVTAANPLLNTIPKIRHTTSHPNPTNLRQHLIDEIRHFEVACQQAGLSYEVIIGARYCLCTALDEAAALTPWGSRSVWSGSGLLVTFHNETWGGEKFFQLLAKLSQSPKENLFLLELINFCLQLGFEGRYRIMDNGRSQLETLKQRLYQLIHSIRGHYPTKLSPNLHSLKKPNKSWKPFLSIWFCLLFLCFLSCILYISLNWRLSNIITPVVSSIYQISLPDVYDRRIQPDVYDRRIQPDVDDRKISPPPPPPEPVKEKKLNLQDRLQNEIFAGLLTISGNVITLKGDGVFKSGSAQIKKSYLNVIQRIAEEMNYYPGEILVIGYTDNIPIASAPFKSNYALSLTRAKSVQEELQRYLDQPERVKTEGKGAENPLVPNNTPANRAKNRRVEITLSVAPDSQTK
ncbi:type IVB secretion system protein IcmH/DotU [Xenorhabdus bharatensis]|uniref:type IVB secretion system protein IcmH/DotU n=1 Tax=Xenorhabdus bharatensis TaxID=3136256 RepID=UPI0030F38BE1